tara:strand:+ start:1068 stop:1253 length:186 start_codon:yes stop_codon:yes gene_type:complete
LEFVFEGVAGLTYSLEISETLAPGSWQQVESIVPTTEGQQTLAYSSEVSADTLFGCIRVEN